MKIYAFAIGTRNSKKVAFTAELLALDYELVTLDPRKGEHKTTEFLSISPLGKIPALQDGNHCIAESNAICRYLSAKNGGKLYGSTPFEKAVADQWMDMFSQTIGPAVGIYYTEEVVKPKFRKQPTDKNNLIEADKQLATLLPLVEAQLSKHRFLAGDTISIADAVAHGYMSSVEQTSLSLAQYPKTQGWVDGLSSMPEWQAAIKRFPDIF
jgi:glutathione S-transferase